MGRPTSASSPLRENAIQLVEVEFGYRVGTSILQIPELVIARGERAFLHGPSGSGKTTLLSLLAGVLAPRSGSVRVLGQDLSSMRGADRDRLRAENIGYIFQMFNLIPYLSVLENIALPCRLSAERRNRLAGRNVVLAAKEMADRLGLGAHLSSAANDLSVGQQQRVAAARALIGAPALVIADEPTSALDADARQQFIELLFERCAEVGSTLVFVSHDRRLDQLFDRSLSLPEINRATAPVANHAPALAGR